MTDYKDADDISPSMCIMPWNGLATDPSGGIRPCCWMQSITPDKFFGSPKEYKNSDYLKEIKNTFLKGEYPDICERCKHDDGKGLESKRTRENKAWTDLGGDWNSIDDQEFTMVDLRLSNLCNLGCVMYGPKNSSLIGKETEEALAKDLPTQEHFHNQYKGTVNLNLINPYSDDDIDEIIDIIPKDARIYCTGGEPSLVKKTTRLLEVLLEKGYNDSVILQFNSNFQALNQKWYDLLSQFKGDMLPSLDGVGRTAEYVRYPCDWERVDHNIREFVKQCGSTWTIKIMPTTSILSVFGFKDMWDWWYNDCRVNLPYINEAIESGACRPHGPNGVLWPWAMRVQCNNRLVSPSYYDIRNLPTTAKQKVIEDIDYILETYEPFRQVQGEVKYLKDVKKQVMLEPNTPFSKTIENLDKLDKIRGNSWRESLPELAVFEHD